MGLFTNAGRAFERTKQALTGEDGPEYVCRACEELVEEDYEFCPHCGEAAVEPLE